VSTDESDRDWAVTLDLILIGLAITLDPLPLTSFFVLLPSKRGVVKGAAFIGGWLVSLAIVVTVTLVATGNQPPKSNTAPSLAALAVKIALGVVLVGIAVRQWRRMGQPKKPKKTPKWQAGVDNMSPAFAMGLAPLVQPWGLIAAGAATVTQAKVSSFESVLALIFFCILGSASLLILEVLAVFRPEKSQAILTGVRTWMDTHTDQVIIIGSLVLGLWLIGHDAYLVATTG
jgi:Sap, sulfolipid-1-addressing protein